MTSSLQVNLMWFVLCLWILVEVGIYWRSERQLNNNKRKERENGRGKRGSAEIGKH